MKRKTWPLFILALGLCLAGAHQSWGALLAYEPFDYPNDGPQLDDRDGGFGWEGGWDDGTTVDFNHLTQNDVSLESPANPLPTAGDHVAGTGGSIQRLFTDSFSMTQENASLYFSLLMRKEADGGTAGDNVEFNLGSTTTTNIVRVGSTSGEQFFINFNGTALNGEEFELGVNYFLVGKLVANGAANDEVHLMIFGEDEMVPDVEPAVWDMTVANASSGNIRVARMVIGANATGALDEIRLGQSWTDVTRVPEPATWGLLVMGLAALGGVCRRRR
jgi:hypothetical protein